MTWLVLILSILAVVSFLSKAMLDSFFKLFWPAVGLDIAHLFYRRWLRIYTIFMPPVERTERGRDQEGNIADYVAQYTKEGYKPGEIGVRLVLRLLGEVPGDVIEGLLAVWPAAARLCRENRPVLTDWAIAGLGSLISGSSGSLAYSSEKRWIQIVALCFGVSILLCTAVSLRVSRFSFLSGIGHFGALGVMVLVMVFKEGGSVVGILAVEAVVVFSAFGTQWFSKIRQNVHAGKPIPWPENKVVLAILPAGFPVLTLFWTQIAPWRVLAFDVAFVLVWQVALFLVEKVYERRLKPLV